MVVMDVMRGLTTSSFWDITSLLYVFVSSGSQNIPYTDKGQHSEPCLE